MAASALGTANLAEPPRVAGAVQPGRRVLAAATALTLAYSSCGHAYAQSARARAPYCVDVLAPPVRGPGDRAVVSRPDHVGGLRLAGHFRAGREPRRD